MEQMNLEEMAIEYKALGVQIETLEERRKELGQQILGVMTTKKMEVGKYRLSQYKRLFVSTSLEQARLFDATKKEERVDQEKVKALYRAGVAAAAILGKSPLGLRSRLTVGVELLISAS
jgi:hypothetical protein